MTTLSVLFDFHDLSLLWNNDIIGIFVCLTLLCAKMYEKLWLIKVLKDFSLIFILRIINDRSRNWYWHGRHIQFYLLQHASPSAKSNTLHNDGQQRSSQTKSTAANSFHTFTACFSWEKISLSEVFIGCRSRRSRQSTEFVRDASENVVRIKFWLENCIKIPLRLFPGIKTEGNFF